jgi:hypothetical protein
MSKAEAQKADIAAAINEAFDELRLTFSHGEAITLKTSMLSPAIIAQATLHGLKQKLVDAAALSRDRDTGRKASIESKFDAVMEVYDRLLSGQWNKPREGASNGTLLAQALVRLTGRPLEAVREQLAKLTDEQKAALEKTQNVAMAILDIKRERIESGGEEEGDNLLAGFMS